MAFGDVPHYIVSFPMGEITKEQFLILMIEAARKLEWELPYTGEDGFIAYTPFRKGSQNEKVHLTINDDMVTIKSESTASRFIDGGWNKRSVEDYMRSLDELKSPVESPEISKFTAERPKTVLSLFIPSGGYIVTPLLVDLNILVFIVMVISGVSIMAPGTDSLLNWGGNYRPVTLEGEYWRLISNFFVHSGLIHLLFNMYALVFIGALLEPNLGSIRFAIAYFVCGILASVASLYWHAYTVSVGASGAIFGMYGVFLAMLTTNFIDKEKRKSLLISIGIFVIYNLMAGMTGNIDNAAHVGGLISGILIGYSFYPGLTNEQDKQMKYGLPAGLILVLALFTFWQYGKIRNDLLIYQQKMRSFASMESQALEVYKLIDNSARETVLHELKDRSLYYWEEDKNLITDLDKLDLPAAFHTRNKTLLVYCDLRLESFELMYMAVQDSTHQYDDRIKSYNIRIDSLVKTLK